MYDEEALILIPAQQDSAFCDRSCDLKHLGQVWKEVRINARGMMATQKLIVFKHATALGNVHAHKLFEAVKVAKKPEVAVPRSFSDYTVVIDKAAIPEGVEVIEK